MYVYPVNHGSLLSSFFFFTLFNIDELVFLRATHQTKVLPTQQLQLQLQLQLLLLPRQIVGGSHLTRDPLSTRSHLVLVSYWPVLILQRLPSRTLARPWLLFKLQAWLWVCFFPSVRGPCTSRSSQETNSSTSYSKCRHRYTIQSKCSLI
jgi:hypothetical protein